jgi:hypothetical protein
MSEVLLFFSFLEGFPYGVTLPMAGTKEGWALVILSFII